METKNPREPESLESLPPRIEALITEAVENAPSLLGDPSRIIQELHSLSVEGRETFFLNLLKRESEEVPPLLRSICLRDERLARNLVEILGSWVSHRSAALLHDLASAPLSKPVAKAIRKSIFRLKSRGLSVEEVADPTPAVYQPPRPAAPEGFLSSVDSGGNRLVWLARPLVPQGMLAVHALLSDLKGIVDFEAFETTRKKFENYLGQFQEEGSFAIVEADPAYCQGLLSEAAEIGRKAGSPPSPEFVKWHSTAGPGPSLPLTPLIYRYIREEEARSRPDLLEKSAALFELPSFRPWFLEREQMEKYLALYKEASGSRLVLTPHQKEGRLEDVYRQAIHEIFDESRRSLYHRRLEEMAYVLFKKGQDREARTGLAAAWGMEEAREILAPHPFLLELVSRSVKVLIEEEEREKEKEKEKESGLIYRP